jgi:hypothetical protein
MIVGTEANEADLECCLGVCEGVGEETTFEPESLGGGDEKEDEDEEEGEVTPLPHSQPPEDLPSPGDLFSQQAGTSVGARQLKHPWMGTGASSGLLPQYGIVLVSFDLQGMSVALVMTRIAHLLKVWYVPPSSPAVGVVTTMMVGPSWSGTPSEKSHPWSFLPVSSLYAYDIDHWFMPLPLFLVLF